MQFNQYMNTFEGPWKKIVKKYANMNQRYLNSAEDAVFWYAELANTGLLAAASWMCGYPSITEIKEEKTVLSGGPGRPPIRPGFVDLFIYDDEGIGHWVEAKRTTNPVFLRRSVRRSSIVNGLLGALSRAEKDSDRIRRNAKYWGGYCVSLAYVPLLLSDEYYGRGLTRAARDERALEISDRIKKIAEARRLCSAVYCCTDHIWITDENGFRPFDFSMVARVERP